MEKNHYPETYKIIIKLNRSLYENIAINHTQNLHKNLSINLSINMCIGDSNVMQT